MSKPDKTVRNVGRLFSIVAGIFCAVLLFLSIIAISATYNDRRSRVISSMEMTVTYADQEYSSILTDLWQAYIPFYEASKEYQSAVNRFFMDTEPLTPIMRNRISELLKKICMRDQRIAWVVLYSPGRSDNCIQYYGSSSLSELPDDFPWLDDIQNKQERMEVYGMHRLTNRYVDVETFAIAGGVPLNVGKGSVIIGYRTGTIAAASRLEPENADTVRYYILSRGQIVYHSGGVYDSNEVYKPTEAFESTVYALSGQIYVMASVTGNASSWLVCQIDNGELLKIAHGRTPFLLLIVVAFFAFSVLVYHIVRMHVNSEVSVIRQGLDILKENNLQYRLPIDFQQSGFSEIAQDINSMSSLLDQSIRKAYYFEVKQKDAEMAHLQAAFNPHFLYNTLEMLRNKAFTNGDEDTAALIADLASIFRGFIGAKAFVPLREELASCRKYMKLLSARYGDIVEFSFDIDTGLLDYGIVRNVFQLLIENYFVHGLDIARHDNSVVISGRHISDTDMLLSVADNGYGMSCADIDELNRSLDRPIRHERESYGLRNLHQRLKLFYGEDYGLHICKSASGGLTVNVRIRKVTVEEYESSRVKRDLNASPDIEPAPPITK